MWLAQPWRGIQTLLCYQRLAAASAHRVSPCLELRQLLFQGQVLLDLLHRASLRLLLGIVGGCDKGARIAQPLRQLPVLLLAYKHAQSTPETMPTRRSGMQELPPAPGCGPAPPWSHRPRRPRPGHSSPAPCWRAAPPAAGAAGCRCRRAALAAPAAHATPPPPRGPHAPAPRQATAAATQSPAPLRPPQQPPAAQPPAGPRAAAAARASPWIPTARPRPCSRAASAWPAAPSSPPAAPSPSLPVSPVSPAASAPPPPAVASPPHPLRRRRRPGRGGRPVVARGWRCARASQSSPAAAAQPCAQASITQRTLTLRTAIGGK
eukprot:COSAG04_NODE_2613_length_3855_cov_1.862620_5_plen_321_part_00